ncbi:hypothetical protein TRFO_05621 [Tritrichomonas foetus]|uniref:Uncharacterized protein n=1 Tax=Tritrichomonas foetus TaxID=1144522 RepID=A0A1J4K5Z2_9EUKA|nr:hypothetical protein TRFO_05621 [Tritrichomonas foetus]|eukprot:OHT06410.1 hypothetical protein TRFO_05621 [Tritrichomonas foetus]
MLLFYPVFLLAFSKGFHSFTVTHKTPFHIRLTKNILYFILDEQPPASVSFSAINKQNQSTPIPMNSLSHIQFFDTIVYVTAPKKVRYTLHFWLVPNELCPGISYASTADMAISTELTAATLSSDFCIFGQAGSSSYSADFLYQTNSTRSRVEFYKHPSKPARKCKKGVKCHYSSSMPFFLRISGASGYKFSSSFLYKVHRSNIDSYECSFKTIPYLVDGPIQMPIGHLNVRHTKCVSAAEDMLSNVTLISGGIIVCIMLLILLHCAGVINLKIILGCTKEADRFKELRQNPYASHIQQDAVESV